MNLHLSFHLFPHEYQLALKDVFRVRTKVNLNCARNSAENGSYRQCSPEISQEMVHVDQFRVKSSGIFFKEQIHRNNFQEWIWFSVVEIKLLTLTLEIKPNNKCNLNLSLLRYSYLLYRAVRFTNITEILIP